MTKPRLLNPYRDESNSRMHAWEKNILRRLVAGCTLVERRSYLADIDNYAVSWYWDTDEPPWGEEQADGPIMMLIGRQAIRPVTCGGGRTTMVLTPAGKRKARSLPAWCAPVSLRMLARHNAPAGVA